MVEGGLYGIQNFQVLLEGRFGFLRGARAGDHGDFHDRFIVVPSESGVPGFRPWRSLPVGGSRFLDDLNELVQLVVPDGLFNGVLKVVTVLRFVSVALVAFFVDATTRLTSFRWMNSWEMTCISFRVHTGLVVSCFLNSSLARPFVRHKLATPIDHYVDCLTFSIKTLDIFPGGLIRFLDDSQEVDGVLGVVDARCEFVQEQFSYFGVARDGTRQQGGEPLTCQTGKSGREDSTFDLIDRAVTDHSMLKVIEMDMRVGGSVVLHVGWFDKMLGGLDSQDSN
ncbi:hypothetical protein PIB30_048103 [Stylosanthes scabra]|uniref:Uncharacterized protein n=1 Tax=Stylosanthes scabra TaxID=79078 RepID=A0ABU6XEL4_9FABA|nr:hypothetical protein [Stylosanthes scabra]